jgi:hypothetical protein
MSTSEKISRCEGETYVVDGLVIQVLGWDNLLNDLLLDLLAKLLSGDFLAVLGADNDGVDAKRDNLQKMLALAKTERISLQLTAPPSFLYSIVTWVLVSGLSHGRRPELRASFIAELSLCDRRTVRGSISGVSSVA